jgi:PilZ domain
MVNRGNSQTGDCEWLGALENKMSRKLNSFQEVLITDISGDRRSRRRYDLDLDLQYKVIRHYHISQTGTGRTINFSGGGVAFATRDVLKPGSTLEVSIAWPIMLNTKCPLKLVITGRVIRSSPELTAMRMEKYEFRTQGVRMMTMRAATAYSA